MFDTMYYTSSLRTRFSLLCALFLLLLPITLGAQTLIEGKVLSTENREPIPYASLYVKEIQSGTVADSKGNFLLHLTPGRYNIILRSMGFQTLHTTLEVREQTQKQVYQLSPSVFQLEEVAVVAKRRREDPAYPIMRALMARTPLYEHLVQKSSMESYTKGTGGIYKVPKFLEKVTTQEGIPFKEYIGKTMVVESQADISFSAPNHYHRKIRAVRSSIPEELKADTASYMNLLTTNVYGIAIGLDGEGGIYNPIREKGLQVYRYRLLGTSTEGGEKVHRIAFVLRDTESIKGELFVVDGRYTLQRMKLKLDLKKAVQQEFSIELNEVAPMLYLPTTYAVNSKINLMGIDAFFNYYTSTRYREISLNPEIEQRLKAQSDQHFRTQKEVLRHTKKLRQNLDTLGYNVPDAFYIPHRGARVTAQLDSLSLQRDSAYWSSIIPTPLTPEEQKSYLQKDSLIQALEKKKSLLARVEKKMGKDDKSALWQMLMGHTYRLGEKTTLETQGLLMGLAHDITYADGYWVGQKATLRHRFSPAVQWSLTPTLSYATRRKKLFWDVSTALLYAPLRRGKLSLQVGHRSMDLATEHQIEEQSSYASVFLFGPGLSSSIRYDRSLVKLTNQLDLAPGLQLNLMGQMRHSAPVATNREWWLSKESSSATPPEGANQEEALLSTQLPAHTTYGFGVALRYNPLPYYRLDHNGRKYHMYEGQRAPIFTLAYRGAIPRQGSFDSDYHWLSLSLHQTLALDYRFLVDYRVEAATYLSDRRVHPEERHYLKGDNSTLSFGYYSPFLFQTPMPYTPLGRSFVRAHTVTYLPKGLISILFPRQMLFHESFHLGGAYSFGASQKPYFEAGYSVWVGGILQIGGYYGGYNFSQKGAFALRLSISLPDFTGSKNN